MRTFDKGCVPQDGGHVSVYTVFACADERHDSSMVCEPLPSESLNESGPFGGSKGRSRNRSGRHFGLCFALPLQPPELEDKAWKKAPCLTWRARWRTMKAESFGFSLSAGTRRTDEESSMKQRDRGE